MKKIQNSFMNLVIFASGSDKQVLASCKASDRSKRLALGYLVLMVAVVSGIVAGQAWSVPLGQVGWVIAPIWCVLILLIDSNFIKQIEERKAKAKLDEKSASAGVGFVLFRLIMIFVISYFNSELVRVIMFKPEIVAEIKIRQDNSIQIKFDSIAVLRSTEDALLAAAQEKVNEAENNLFEVVSQYDTELKNARDSSTYYGQLLLREIDGTGGLTKTKGDEDVARAIREQKKNWDETIVRLVEQRKSTADSSAQVSLISMAREERDTVQARHGRKMLALDLVQQKEQDLILSRPVNGLSFMISVLNDIAKRDMIIWAVFGLFLFIESAPVLIKFTSRPDSYTYIIANNIKDEEEDFKNLRTP